MLPAALPVPRNRAAQALCAPGDRILVDVGANRLLRCALDFGRRGKIRKSLRQFNRPVQHCLPRHFANDRLGEVRNLVTEEMFLLLCQLSHDRVSPY